MALKFLTFDLDPSCRELRDDGVLVPLSPKTFDVLCYMALHHDRMVTKSELLDKFWSANVSEAALQQAISRLRKATRCKDQSVIRTYHGLGFRFVPDVQDIVAVTATEPSNPSSPLRQQRLVAVLSLRFASMSVDRATFTQFLQASEACVATYQGEALRMAVDGFAVSFGLNAHYEDPARRAVHCAVALSDRAKDYDDIGPIIAIDHGPVEWHDGPDEPEWSLPSEIERGAVTLAAGGQRNDILLSAAAQHQLQDEITCAPVQGGFKLHVAHDMQAGVPGRPRLQQTKFIGRAAEMAFLEKSLETVEAGHGQGVVLEGPAGIGKTRLLGEFLATLETRPYRLEKFQCLPGLSNSPLAPIREMCLALFSTAPPGTVATDVDGALHGELLGHAPQSADVLNALSEHQRRQQSYALITRMLKAYCEKQLLVLAFEDVHWLDATSRAFLDAVIQQVDGMRLLIVMTTRPTEDPSLSESVVHVSTLAHHDGLTLLHDNTSDIALDARLADDLVRRAAGNPFFIEELALAAQSGRDPSRDLPETVQAVISVRIGALDAQARTFLFVMAVIGPDARIDLIIHLLGDTQDNVEATAQRVRSMGFIRMEPDRYSFRHMLINDAAYTMLAAENRRNLHRDIAAYLESSAPDWTALAETLAWHHQEAGQTDQASGYWLKAGQGALRRSAHHEAIVFAQNGLKMIPVDNPETVKRELELQLCLAAALAAIRGYAVTETGAAYSRALSLNKTIRDPKANIRALVGLWIHTWVRGQLSESLAYANKLLDVAKVIKDPALSLQAHAGVGQVLFHKGQMKEALAHLLDGVKAVEQSPPSTQPSQRSAVACSAFTSWTYSMLGNVGETKRFLDVSYDYAHLSENPLAKAIHFGLCSEPLMVIGEIEACLKYADHGIAVSRAHDFAFWLGTGLMSRGWALARLGRLAAAFEAIDEGFLVIKGTGAGVQLANWSGVQAEAYLIAGRFEEGIKAADYALSCAARTDDVYFTPRIHAVAARLYEGLNDPDRAAKHARHASDLLRQFDMVPGVIALDT